MHPSFKQVQDLRKEIVKKNPIYQGDYNLPGKVESKLRKISRLFHAELRARRWLHEE